MQFTVGDEVKIIGLFGFEYEKATVVELWHDWRGIEYARLLCCRGGYRNESIERLKMFNS